MKIFKILVLTLLVFTGEKMMAQYAVVVNNTALSYTTQFDLSCGTVSVGVGAFSTDSTALCGATPTLNQVLATFIDVTCTPPLAYAEVLTPPFLPYSQTYILCSGTPITFSIELAPSGNYVFIIN